MEYSFRHSMPGRVRLNVPALCRNRGVSEKFLAWLKAQAGVRSARINYDCASLVLEYDQKQEPMLRLMLKRVKTASFDPDATGFIVLAGTNTYTGGTTVIGTTLEFATAASLPATGAVTLNDGVLAFGFASAVAVVRPRSARKRALASGSWTSRGSKTRRARK